MAIGMLVVVAEVDRAQRMGRAEQRIVCKLPDGDSTEAEIVRQVLDQIELLQRTSHAQIHSDRTSFDDSVRHWRYATGTRVDEEPGDVLDEYEGRVAPALMEKMQIGLVEAITNSLHHAYQAGRLDNCREFRERRWWMFTHELDGMLQVIVCDLGIGISRSLPMKWDRNILKKIRNFFRFLPPDLASIKTALVLGETSTEETNRGKGMHQIWNALHESDVGGVVIMSGSSHLAYDAEEAETAEGNYDTSLLGTLISWKVSVSDAARESDGGNCD
ncbi:hypothetical protein [Altericroceibacterium endophyticum]|uniref:ATP-binding protein n=1 Tax=Altericroceibacterium endophyticum TaxID=1808508 RepID=A0A6I4T4K1_9SPHN|nr:hypothetical protein [Altericroceibacterium endophyticum]MXO64870.1 hypothetical protein [Altericroceibacterium endophyticum]